MSLLSWRSRSALLTICTSGVQRDRDRDRARVGAVRGFSRGPWSRRADDDCVPGVGVGACVDARVHACVDACVGGCVGGCVEVCVDTPTAGAVPPALLPTLPGADASVGVGASVGHGLHCDRCVVCVVCVG